MASEQQSSLRRSRRAWWLKVAREAAGYKLAGAADAIGLSTKSASSVSDWENEVSDPKLSQLERLASVYGVPLALLSDPPPTDAERLERMKELGRVAIDVAHEDSEAGEEPNPAADDGPGDRPRKQTA